MNRWGGAILAFGAMSSMACGDLTGATGAKGRVNYSLYTHYEVDQWDLREVSLVTGHPQLIQTNLTEKGTDQLSGSASDIVHQVEPAEGVEVSNQDSDDDIADVTVTVSDPGDYTLSSELDGYVFDYLDLSFDSPDELELITWVRNPDDDEFDAAEGDSIDIEEGGQVTVLPIPLADGERLAGDISVEITVFPETSAVRGENIYGVYEQGVTSSDTPVSLYFVEPGTVTITVSDGPNGVEAVQVFEVEAVEQPEV